ncbi:metal-dependent hydrolase [Qipengyuania nanhaisediminis]|uniref:metal-dependent hydrolase n=1 Tax=Qipengyuania nanhaisediminis TaxID=604088 RepID=UPI0038B409E8
MDNLTHSLVGAVLGQAGLKRRTGLAMPALIIGANLPDIDAACFFWLEGAEHLGFRRGITHGPPALVLLPLVLAGLLWGWDRWQAKRGTRPKDRLPVHFGWLYALGFLGALSHPLLDWLNVYGIRFFEPFSSAWSYGDTLFIIDVWLWALLGLTLWASLRSEKKGGKWRRPAWIGIAVGLAYIGANWAISAGIKASSHSPYGLQADLIPSPPPLEFWKRDVIYRDPETGRWMMIDYSPGSAIPDAVPVAQGQPCAIPDLSALRKEDGELDAFLFWSRAPFATRAQGGGIVLHDARFYDPRARDRFSIALPDTPCEEPAGE